MSNFKQISHKEAVEFLLPRHYSGRKPPISYAFGAFVNGQLKAVITYGSPASPSLCKGVAGECYRKQVIELNRLCREDDYTPPLSQLVAYSLNELRERNLIVVSFSDTAMNHHGYIYQACNFLYTGCTKKRTDKYTEGNKHSRHYDNNNQVARKVRTAKHRYIYVCASSKKNRKQMLSDLKYPVLPYPKGDNNEDYRLGYVLQQEVIPMDEWEKERRNGNG